ncbi:hypothetical protein [Corynebacterium lubricantis]|uniref:hypothetical protein n=1 Tax=Corynebacterium lubricantis TaxID=541095 RepID=UPI000362706E|nr:hypothetical protein [Corynebacterium lubricantis]
MSFVVLVCVVLGTSEDVVSDGCSDVTGADVGASVVLGCAVDEGAAEALALAEVVTCVVEVVDSELPPESYAEQALRARIPTEPSTNSMDCAVRIEVSLSSVGNSSKNVKSDST